MSEKTTTGKRYQHVRNVIYRQPWAILDDYLETIAEIFERHVVGDQIDFAAKDTSSKPDSGYEIQGNVATIKIRGPIFPRANLMTKYSGATSAERVGKALDEALSDDSVSTIVLHIDSPGGSVMGIPELSTKIYDARDSGKTIVAFGEGLVASAAYYLASQADIVLASEGSMVGSIGVIAQIHSFDRADKNEGIDSTIIRSSELKAIGAGAVTPNQLTVLQREVKTYFDMFKGAVSRGRPSIDIESVSTGEMWIGAQAVDKGLVDGISTMAEIIATYGDS